MVRQQVLLSLQMRPAIALKFVAMLYLKNLVDRLREPGETAD